MVYEQGLGRVKCVGEGESLQDRVEGGEKQWMGVVDVAWWREDRNIHSFVLFLRQKQPL